ncbi:MAG: signal peptidase I [Deltaproteobacteria bacterium]|nr:signal peptidase I [Deltaproteobacteria bacterium]
MASKPAPPASAAPSGLAPRKSLWREYGEALIIAVILAVVIRAFVVQAFSIPSGSMQPTLLIHDYLLVNKLSYGIRNPFTNKVLVSLGRPQRGDVAVFIYPQDPSKDYIKRVIGLPGDRIQIVNKKVFINGKPYETPQAVYTDPAINPPPVHPGDSSRDNLEPVVVPPDSYFVMGDNRDHSFDSRFWGFVHLDALRGRAFIIYFSWDSALPPDTPLYVALPLALKELATKFTWDSKTFSLRWNRLGKIIR